MTTLEAITERHTRTLPDGWEWKKLSDVLDSFESGSRPPGGAVGVTSGVPSISAEQMTDRGIFDFDMMRYVPRDYYDEMKRGHIAPGDILIVKDGATTGKTCFVDDDFPFKEAVVNEHVFVCRPNKQLVEPRFLFYWLWSPPGQHAIRSTFQGAAIGGINKRFVDAVEVPVAPLAEQKRIAAILNEQIAAVDKARAAAQDRLVSTKVLLDAYLRETFATLAHAKTVSLGDIAARDITYGIVQSGNHCPDGIPTVRGGDIKGFRIDVKQLKRVDANISAHYTRTILQGDEVLLVIRGFPGNVALVGDELVGCNVAREIAVIAVPSTWSRSYVQYAIASPTVQQYIVDKTKGAAQQGINLSDVAELRIPKIGIADQRKLVKRISTAVQATELAIAAAQEALDAAEALPAVLLRRAFAGEL